MKNGQLVGTVRRRRRDRRRHPRHDHPRQEAGASGRSDVYRHRHRHLGGQGVLIDDDQRLLAEASRAPDGQPPARRAGPSRTRRTGGAASRRCWTRSPRPTGSAAVRGIGLSGQMHGATSARRRRPRCCARRSCGTTAAAWRKRAELGRPTRASRAVTGNIAMPGFTAPKLHVGAQRTSRRSSARSRRCCCPRTTCASG